MGLNAHEENGLIKDHTTLLTQLDERSKSNVHRLNKLDEKVDELSRVHSTLNSMQTEIKHISEKIDKVGKDAEHRKELREKELDAEEKIQKERILAEREKNEKLVQALENIGKKSNTEKVVDSLIPVGIVLALYLISIATNGGAFW